MVSRITAALAARSKTIQEKEKGFTLIELLVVVIIIGVLAAIAIPVYLGVQSNAVDSAVKSDLTNLKTAVVAYSTDNSGVLTDGTLALTALSEYVTIDAESYNGTGAAMPVIDVNVAADAQSFCIDATGENGNTFHVTDTEAPAEDGCP